MKSKKSWSLISWKFVVSKRKNIFFKIQKIRKMELKNLANHLAESSENNDRKNEQQQQQLNQQQQQNHHQQQQQRLMTIKPTTTTISSLSLHPLENCWVFWHYRRARRRSTKKWMDCQRTLVEIDTIESFWMFFAKQRSPSMVRINQDYALFRKGIKPMWEDPANMNGGQWIFILQKSQDNYDQIINELWYKIIMAMLGSIFHKDIIEQICGIVFSMRISCFTKISIWVTDYRAIKQILILGHELKRLTKFNDCILFRRNDNMQTKFIL
uniref:Eukaryotic translation initiation factor 4E-1A-like n=1 Tax=Dermatophagoides pteronyssinus TaxID=6956 RepID=A0A6P6YCB0_DERPT|nr:eukaryotic translation initiation factor 4E-1A-like [Dermatophagoides pteronyssinus]